MAMLAVQTILSWASLVYPIALQHGLPPELVLAVIAVESNGNASAISILGAVGLMQVMPCDSPAYENRPALGRMFRDRPTTDALLDPETNIRWGCRILRGYVDLYPDDPWRGVAAYYAGPGNVPKEDKITHEGAQKYMRLVKAAMKSLFPFYRLEV